MPGTVPETAVAAPVVPLCAIRSPLAEAGEGPTPGIAGPVTGGSIGAGASETDAPLETGGVCAAASPGEGAAIAVDTVVAPVELVTPGALMALVGLAAGTVEAGAAAEPVILGC